MPIRTQLLKKWAGPDPEKHRIYATDDNKPAPAEAVLHWILLANSTGFLPSDAVLVRHMLSSCVHLFVRSSVRLSVTSRYCIETTGRIELVFGMQASCRLSHTVL